MAQQVAADLNMPDAAGALSARGHGQTGDRHVDLDDLRDVAQSGALGANRQRVRTRLRPARAQTRRPASRRGAGVLAAPVAAGRTKSALRAGSALRISSASRHRRSSDPNAERHRKRRGARRQSANRSNSTDVKRAAQLQRSTDLLARTPPTIEMSQKPVANPVSSQLDTQIATLKSQLAAARQQYTDNYPTVVSLKAQLAQAEGSVQDAAAPSGRRASRAGPIRSTRR